MGNGKSAQKVTLSNEQVAEMVMGMEVPKKVEVFDNFRYRMTTASAKPVALAFRKAAQAVTSV